MCDSINLLSIAKIIQIHHFVAVAVTVTVAYYPPFLSFLFHFFFSLRSIQKYVDYFHQIKLIGFHDMSIAEIWGNEWWWCTALWKKSKMHKAVSFLFLSLCVFLGNVMRITLIWRKRKGSLESHLENIVAARLRIATW